MLPDSSALRTPNGQSMELTVQQSLQQFQSIVAVASEGVVIVTASGAIAYANSVAMFLLAQGRSTLVGEPFGLPLSPNDEKVTAEVLAEDASLRTVEMQVEHLDPDSGTTVLRLCDVTGAQQRVAAAQKEVRHRDEFLAMLSHELRNPLAAIRGATSLLEVSGLDESSRAEAHTIINRQFKHLSRILDDLLDVTRALRGKLLLNRSRVRLNQILLDAVEAIQPLMDSRRQALELNLPDHDVWVDADETRLEQLVVNLLHNAAKFAPDNGTVGLSASTSHARLTIRVRDDGPGISEDVRETLFNAFVQGKQPLDRSDGGLGIGLMLVRRFAELHGGIVEAGPNETGRGTCFTVNLPLLEISPKPESRVDNAPQACHMRVLVAEDMADLRLLLKRILSSDGFDVVEAADGLEAVSLMLSEPLDVALIDIGLPGLNGYEVAKSIRRSGQSKRPWLVAVTGYGRAEDVESAWEAGFDFHLVKPLQIPVLRKLLAQLMSDDPNDRGDDRFAHRQSSR
jgi:signal transduction histidine kinase/ActR/RegA family two-component response regulator